MRLSKKAKAIIPIIVIMATIIIGAIYGVKYEKSIRPDIKMNGKTNIVLSLNEEFVDEGAIASFKENDISNLIKTEGEVNVSKAGNYKITYEVTYNKKKVKKTRYVNVIDVTAPVITLNGEETKTLYVGDAYNEEGAKAIDDNDGDISDKVTIEGTVDNNTIGTYELTYNIEDESENKSSIKRIINVVAKPAPQPKPSTTSFVSGGSGTLPVLMYHFFFDDTIGQKGNDNNWMSKTDFDNQMRYLSENNFYYPTWQEVEDFVDGKISLPANSVVITIDDGDRTFIDLAIPILEKYNVHATSFAVGAWTAGEIADYSRRSNNIFTEAHSYDAHKAGSNGKGLLVNMTYDQVKEDAKKVSDAIGGSTIFCYPFGHYNDTVINALIDTGYHMAFTTVGGYVKPGQNKMKLPRVRMSRGISLSDFAKKVA